VVLLEKAIRFSSSIFTFTFTIKNKINRKTLSSSCLALSGLWLNTIFNSSDGSPPATHLLFISLLLSIFNLLILAFDINHISVLFIAPPPLALPLNVITYEALVTGIV
jgi:hypothetical protein